MRTRLEQSNPVQSVLVRKTNLMTGTVTDTTETNKKQSSFYNKMTDVSTVRFEELRNQGNIINNDMTQIKHTVLAPPTQYVQTRNRWTVSGSTQTLTLSERDTTPDNLHNGRNWLESSLIVPSVADVYASIGTKVSASYNLANEQSIVLAAAYSAAADSKALALVTMAEAKKTLAIGEQLIESLQTFRHLVERSGGNLFMTPRGLLALSGSAANAWLMYRYGIMPLVYEVGAYVEIVGGKNSKRVRFTSSKSYQNNLSSSPAFTNISDYIAESRPYYRSRYDTISAGVLVTTDQSSPLSDFGLDRVMTSAWELIPFSFVIDWFANVSDTIAAHEGRFGQRVLSSWITVDTQYMATHQVLSQGRDWQNGSTKIKGSVTRDFSVSETLSYRRRIANPPLSTLPSFDVKLNWRRFADLAALARSVLLKGQNKKSIRLKGR